VVIMVCAREREEQSRMGVTAREALMVKHLSAMASSLSPALMHESCFHAHEMHSVCRNACADVHRSKTASAYVMHVRVALLGCLTQVYRLSVCLSIRQTSLKYAHVCCTAWARGVGCQPSIRCALSVLRYPANNERRDAK
jgi:hypothetical protein